MVAQPLVWLDHKWQVIPIRVLEKQDFFWVDMLAGSLLNILAFN